MDQDTEKAIERLQDNLYVIRRMAGWTAEDLGEKIGVTKQTIRNLERRNNNAKMSKTQYIAIRAVLDYEVENNPDNQALAKVIEVLLDSEEMPEEDYEQVREAVTFASNSVAGGTSNESVVAMLGKLLVDTPIISVGLIQSGVWLARMLKK